MSTSYAGVTSVLQLDPGAGYQTIAGMRDIELDPGEVRTREADDLADDYEVLGVIDRVGGGSCKGEAFFDPAGASQFLLNALFNTPVEEPWKVIWSDTANTEESFSGIMTKFPRKANRTDSLMQSIEIAISQKMTLAVA